METNTHRQLKRLAVDFLRRLGGLAVAEEVRCPISRYRVDVAGYIDRRPRRVRNGVERDSRATPSLASLHEPVQKSRRWWRSEPRTVLIECKQSRADFLRDNRDNRKLLAQRDDLQHIRSSIERTQIPVIEPQLRRDGASLFPELDEWNYEESRLPSYHKVNRRLRRLERQLYGETKFHMIAQYRLADRVFLAAPAGLIRPSELPLGWGLLECPEERLVDFDPDTNHDEPALLSVKQDATTLDARPHHRQTLLRNIAVAASFAAQAAVEVAETSPALA